MPGECFECLDRRVRVRRLRIVVVADTVQRAYELNTVLYPLERAQDRPYLRCRHPREQSHRRCCECILDVVPAGNPQLRRRDEDVFHTVPSDDKHPICTDKCPLCQLFFAAEKAYPARRTRRHTARLRVVRIQHEEVLRRLRGKEFLLHCLIDLHRAVADDVIRRHIQFSDDVRVKMCRCLHLVA